MKTKVIPFKPSVTDVAPQVAAANELQKIIEEYAVEGWEFVSLNSMSTTVKPTGCLKGNAPAIPVSMQLLIFKK
jgi:hypothetical protein|tara:strand:+ start:260 stop:481 length:222 start_codon:yes stop_codon:yes gene_type:complete